MVAMAERRLGERLTTVIGDFLTVPLPRCDAITASLALHHITTARRKGAMYRRCFAALGRGGVLINADCCLASDARMQAADRASWLAHLHHHYSARQAAAFLRAWAREDVYFPLNDEIRLLRAAGFSVEIPWRRGSFAVIVGCKPRGLV
jgi:hypothetical protein